MLLPCVLACAVSFQASTAPQDPSLFTTLVARFDALGNRLTATHETEMRGQIALQWLRALNDVLASVPIERTNGPHEPWLNAHEPLVVYSEPAGQWLIRNDLILRLHDENNNSIAADDIAWLAVTNGLPGECEGYVPCYAYGMNRLEGEYLRRHPRGRHRGEALAKIRETLKIVLDDLLKKPYAGDFLKVPDDCADLLTSIRPLRAAVVAGGDADTSVPVKLIDRLTAYCPRR